MTNILSIIDNFSLQVQASYRFYRCNIFFNSFHHWEEQDSNLQLKWDLIYSQAALTSSAIFLSFRTGFEPVYLPWKG